MQKNTENKYQNKIFTLPNILSFFRIFLVVPIIVLYVQAQYVGVLIVLVISGLSDIVDGIIARKFNMVTALGKILDPLADKATQFALILCLSVNYPVLWLLIGCFVIKEGFQLVAGGINWTKGIMLKGALISGKICTTVLFLSLIFMVLVPDLPHAAVACITLVDLCFMMISFVDYCITYAKRANKFQPIEESDN